MALFLDVRAKEIKVFEDKVFNSFCDFLFQPNVIFCACGLFPRMEFFICLNGYVSDGLAARMVEGDLCKACDVGKWSFFCNCAQGNWFALFCS